MLTHISTLDELEKEAADIDAFLNITCGDDPNECTARGADLVVHMARTGKMLADAKFWQDKAVRESILNRLNIDIAPMILKRLIEAEAARENYLVTLIDRMNRTCVHQLDFLRTLISKAKAEMQYQGWQK